MTSATVTRWSRAFVVVGVAWFVCWNGAVVAGFDRSATVVLGLQGFVFSVVFGKAYSLVPTYFDRELAFPNAAGAHLLLATLGTGALFVDAVGGGGPPMEIVGATAWIGVVGATAWFAGVCVFVGTLGWTVRDNLTGRETATGEINRHRRRIDRAANAVVPVVMAYLLAGAALPALDALGSSPGLLALDALGTSSALVAPGPAATHVLAAGTATLLVFGIGFRLLPRFFVSTPRPWLVAVVLPAGALAPALLAVDFQGGRLFAAGATLQAVAIVGFAIAVADMYRRTDRARIGFHGVLAGAVLGVVAVALGWGAGVADLDPIVLDAHYRLAVGGFLGLTIVGVTYQFYPPAIGTAPGVDDRTALASMVLLAVGLTIEAVGIATDAGSIAGVGAAIALAGAVVYAWILYALFWQRR